MPRAPWEHPTQRNGLWGKGSLSCLGVSGVLCFCTYACEKSLVAASVEGGWGGIYGARSCLQNLTVLGEGVFVCVYV